MFELVPVSETQITAQQIHLKNFQDDFFKFLDVSERTLATYHRALKQIFKYLGDNKINTPSYDDILAFKKHLENNNRKPATIALYLAAARRFFSWLEQRGLYKNITIGIKAPKQEKGHKRDYFNVQQLKDVLNNVHSKRDTAIMALLATCGLRTVEVVRANIEDLRILGDVTVLYVQGKGRKDKTEFVKISDTVEQIIRDYLKTRDVKTDKEPLFVSNSNRNKNGRMTTRSISAIAKTAIRKAGFNSSRLSAHSLRHTAVTLTLLAGQDLADVQAFARHSNISTTQIYSHAVDRMNSKCENILSNLLYS